MRRNVQVPAYRVVTREVLPYELTVHNDLIRSSAAFVTGKGPALHERNPKGAEIARISLAYHRTGHVFARLQRSVLLHREHHVTRISGSGKSVSQCS